jgi:hypothetical protein
MGEAEPLLHAPREARDIRIALVREIDEIEEVAVHPSTGRRRETVAARDRFAADPEVASATILEDGTIEIGFRGDDDASARLLAGAVAAGIRIVSFARAASDLEELFLQVTAHDPIDAPADPAAA